MSAVASACLQQSHFLSVVCTTVGTMVHFQSTIFPNALKMEGIEHEFAISEILDILFQLRAVCFPNNVPTWYDITLSGLKINWLPFMALVPVV